MKHFTKKLFLMVLITEMGNHSCAFGNPLVVQITYLQSEDPIPPKVKAFAMRYTKLYQGILYLDENQTRFVNAALLERGRSIHNSLSNKDCSKRSTIDQATIKLIRENYVIRMNSILTAEQKARWDSDRLRMKQIGQKSNFSNGGRVGALISEQTLADDDDGINGLTGD